MSVSIPCFAFSCMGMCYTVIPITFVPWLAHFRKTYRHTDILLSYLYTYLSRLYAKMHNNIYLTNLIQLQDGYVIITTDDDQDKLFQGKVKEELNQHDFITITPPELKPKK